MDAQTAKQLFSEADRLFRQGRYEPALNVLIQLNQEFANKKNILYPAALCLEKLGRIEEAKVLCHQIIGLYDYQKARDLLHRLDTAPQFADAAVDDVELAARPWPDEQPYGPAVTPPPSSAGNNNLYALMGSLAAMLIACVLPIIAVPREITTGSEGILALVVLLGSGITLYVVMCYIFKRICENAGTEPGFLIWAPVLSIIPIMRAARMDFLWLLVNFVPFVGGFVFGLILGIKLCQACDKPPALGLLFLVPGLNMVLLFYLAFSQSDGHYAAADGYGHIPEKNELDATPFYPGEERRSSNLAAIIIIIVVVIIAIIILAFPFLVLRTRSDTTVSFEIETPGVTFHTTDTSDRPRARQRPDQPTAQVDYPPPAQPFAQTTARPPAFDHGVMELPTKTLMLPDNVPLELVQIPPGSFQMGAPDTERRRQRIEGPVRNINIGYAFYMGRYEVTQQQWLAIMGAFPDAPPASSGASRTHPAGHGPTYPVYNVSWHDAQDFITALNGYLEATGQAGVRVRLPSESEWEYACRAGTQTRFYFGDSLYVEDDCADDGERGRYMWYCGNNTPSGAKPVGQLAPNAFGLYDMHGNVWEWVEDDYTDSLLNLPGDGRPYVEHPRGGMRMRRGGAWDGPAWLCRSADRHHYGRNAWFHTLGFRLAAN